MADVTLVAIPYANPTRSFTFQSLEEYERKAAVLAKRGIEEFEFDFQDGSAEDAALFQAVSKRHFLPVAVYFERVVDLNEHDKSALYVLLSHFGMDLEDALDKVDDARVFDGSLEDYAHELVDDLGVEGISNNEAYFDFETFGRDLGFDLDPDDEGDAALLELDDEERGEQYVDNIGGVSELGKELVERYFDYEKLARDLDVAGDVVVFEFPDGHERVLTNPLEF